MAADRSKVISINRTPGDYIRSTRHLSLEERGAYQDILDQIVEIGQDNDPPAIPDDARAIAGLLGCTVETWRRLKRRLCFGRLAVLVCEGGLISQGRVVEEIEEARKRIARSQKAGKASGKARRKSAILRERLLNSSSSQVEPGANSNRNSKRTSHESRVTNNERPTEPSVPTVSEREREFSSTTRGRGREENQTPTDDWLRMKVREIRNDPVLTELSFREPDDYIEAVRDLTGYSPDELADRTGDDAIRPHREESHASM